MHTTLRLLLLVVIATAGVARAQGSAEPRLLGWATLPQATRTPGPSSGHFIKPAHGITPPFEGAQPVPGFSGLLVNADGSFLAMPDNGFGSKGNSADYVLGSYRVTPSFEPRRHGAPGSVRVDNFTPFRDPRGLLRNGRGVDLTLSADRATYARGEDVDSGLPVDPVIARERLLTGYDFDVESVARAQDGTLWVGDEFGPYLLHFAADGVLLDEPVPHPTLKSPSHPEVLAGKAAPTLSNSNGFECLAFDARKRFLYAMPEGAPSVDSMRPIPGDERVVELFQFDPIQRAYTGRSFRYRKDGERAANKILIGDMANVGPDLFVLIERDGLDGAEARLKRLYLIDLNVRDARGVLVKRLLADLLDIADPQRIGGSARFRMPFDSIEALHPIDASTLAIAIDSNFPTEDARGRGKPDDSEIITLRFPRPLASYAPRRASPRP